MARLVWSARRWISRFQRRTRLPLMVSLAHHAAAAIGRDDEGLGFGITGFAEAVPPAANALDGEGGGAGVDANIDPTLVGGNVVDAIGRDLAELGDLEVMHPN